MHPRAFGTGFIQYIRSTGKRETHNVALGMLPNVPCPALSFAGKKEKKKKWQRERDRETMLPPVMAWSTGSANAECGPSLERKRITQMWLWVCGQMFHALPFPLLAKRERQRRCYPHPPASPWGHETLAALTKDVAHAEKQSGVQEYLVEVLLDTKCNPDFPCRDLLSVGDCQHDDIHICCSHNHLCHALSSEIIDVKDDPGACFFMRTGLQWRCKEDRTELEWVLKSCLTATALSINVFASIPNSSRLFFSVQRNPVLNALVMPLWIRAATQPISAHWSDPEWLGWTNNLHMQQWLQQIQTRHNSKTLLLKTKS